MKKLNSLLVVFVVLLISFQLKAQGTWALQSNPLGSGDSAMVGKIQFVSSTEGWMSGRGGTLLHTIDAGVNWTIVTPFPGDSVFSFADPGFNLCFVNQTKGWVMEALGTWMDNAHGAVVYKTTDGGSSWKRIVLSDSAGVIGAQLQFIDANNGWASVFNRTTGKGNLLKTTDGGNSWTMVKSLPASDEADTFYFTDENTGWLMKVNDHPSVFEISKTTDGGATFNVQYSDNITNADSISGHGGMQFTDATHGWVVGANNRILKTTDGGSNWKLLTNSGIDTYANNRCLFFLDANVGWIGTSTYEPNQPNKYFILHTTDGGNNWTQQNISFFNNPVFNLYFLNQQEGWFTADYGMIAHYNEPASTGTLNINLVSHNTQQNAPKNNLWFVNEYGGYAWIAGDSSLIARSKDFQSWDVLNNGIQEGINQLEFLNSDTIFAAGQKGSIYKTLNGGQNWSVVYRDTNQTNFINNIKFFDSMNGMAYGDQAPNASTMAILSTTDGGNTWVNNNKYIYGSIFLSEEIAFASPSYVYLCGYVPNTNPTDQGIWKSTDRGTSWNFHSVGYTRKDSLTLVRVIMFKNSQIGYAAKQDSSLWMTVDGGISWAKIYQAPSLINNIAGIANSSVVYCVGRNGLITKINTEPTITVQQQMSDTSMDFFYGNFLTENKGYLLDYYNRSGNFYTTFQGPTVVNDKGMNITSYKLYQNYPNPFNPTTAINYSVPKAGFVTLKIYDVLGNVIATLVNNEKAAGNYNLEFNGSRLASGVYLCRMQAGNFVETKKLVLLK